MRNNTKKKIPHSVISRLFVYLRELTQLDKLNIRVISSAELGERTNLSDTQVRKDLGYFGQFGISGSGYAVGELKETLKKILGKDKVWKVAIVGVGHLGSALLTYSGFNIHGLKIVAAFDVDPKKQGQKFQDVTILPIEEIKQEVKKKKVSLSIITVPGDKAQEVAEALIDAGVECIMNFAPTSLNVPENVKVKDVDLSKGLETLSYFLVAKNENSKK